MLAGSGMLGALWPRHAHAEHNVRDRCQVEEVARHVMAKYRAVPMLQDASNLYSLYNLNGKDYFS